MHELLGQFKYLWRKPEKGLMYVAKVYIAATAAIGTHTSINFSLKH